MKALNLPPSDPRLFAMTDAQWLWAYHNVIKDDIEDAEMWENRLIFLGSFSNPEMAKHIIEEKRAHEDAKNNVNGVAPNRNSYKKSTMQSDSFETEFKAAQLGYDPTSGISAEEFLAQKEAELKVSEELDILNAPFDELMKKGQVMDASETVKGDPYMKEADFLDHVFAIEQELFSRRQKETEVPIGFDSLEEYQAHFAAQEKNATKPQTEQQDDDLKRALEERGLTLEDLDVIEIDDE